MFLIVVRANEHWKNCSEPPSDWSCHLSVEALHLCLQGLGTGGWKTLPSSLSGTPLIR